jgi:hypothetical protein
MLYRNNLMLESTFLKIEREVDGDWQGNQERVKVFIIHKRKIIGG